MIRLDMKNYSMILTGKLEKYQRYQIGKFDKYEYLKGEELLAPGESTVIEQAKFTSSPLVKALEKQLKTKVKTN